MVQRPKTISKNPGVYIFRKESAPLYVGKAASLKSRLGSYFLHGTAHSSKTREMLKEATSVETIELASEIEALIKETELIKKWRPKYNILMRDDKNYFYVGFTQEEFPRVFVTHQPQNEHLGIRGKSLASPMTARGMATKTYDLPPAAYVGPFTSGSALYAVLRLLRRIFPYCTCKGMHKRPCLNSQIGRCVGICCTVSKSEELRIRPREREKIKKEYKRGISMMRAVLEGRRTHLIRELKTAMRGAVKEERYEDAARFRDQIIGLEDIFLHRPVIRPPLESRAEWPTIVARLQGLLKTMRPIKRIEGYDIANIGKEAMTASMVVFEDGRAKKSDYRKFRIKTVAGQSDVDSHKEVIRRRLAHSEWPFPDIMMIDGGVPQRNAVKLVFEEFSHAHPDTPLPILTALAKREEILITDRGAIPLKKQHRTILHLFQRIRDESHRFARVYHHLLRSKSYVRSR